MERDDRASVATFFSDSALVANSTITLGESSAHHARVRRLGTGDAVRLTDGRGSLAAGAIAGIGRDALTVVLSSTIDRAQRPPAIHLAVPIGDRDRTLWLAEKAAELGVTSWQPVEFKRSSSVATRGVGSGFARKLETRMIAAIEQSGGAWLPEIAPETSVERLAVLESPRNRILLDPDGMPLPDVVRLAHGAEPMLLFGPEGGIEAEERAALIDAGWRPAKLAESTLRFETAGIAAVAVVRAMNLGHGG